MTKKHKNLFLHFSVFVFFTSTSGLARDGGGHGGGNGRPITIKAQVCFTSPAKEEVQEIRFVLPSHNTHGKDYSTLAREGGHGGGNGTPLNHLRSAQDNLRLVSKDEIVLTALTEKVTEFSDQLLVMFESPAVKSFPFLDDLSQIALDKNHCAVLSLFRVDFENGQLSASENLLKTPFIKAKAISLAAIYRLGELLGGGVKEANASELNEYVYSDDIKRDDRTEVFKSKVNALFSSGRALVTLENDAMQRFQRSKSLLGDFWFELLENERLDLSLRRLALPWNLTNKFPGENDQPYALAFASEEYPIQRGVLEVLKEINPQAYECDFGFRLRLKMERAEQRTWGYQGAREYQLFVMPPIEPETKIDESPGKWIQRNEDRIPFPFAKLTLSKNGISEQYEQLVLLGMNASRDILWSFGGLSGKCWN